MDRESTYFIATFAVFTASMVLALVAARGLTGLARLLAVKYGIVSHVTERSSHTRDTARLGGLGLNGGFLIGAGLFLAALWFMPHRGAVMIGYNPELVGWLAIGWAGMFLTGLLDDLLDLPALVKLALMVIAATASVWGGRMAPNLVEFPYIPSWLDRALEIAAAVFWVIFFTNGFNFMDGMDGLAANFARAAATFMFVSVLVGTFILGVPHMIRGEAYLLPILAMACWGFLHWNRPPAQVFMGDCGSLSLGYLLAVYLLLGATQRLGFYLGWVTSLTILMPFLFDVVLTLIRRARRGENLLKAHKEHLYQRLNQTGRGHARVLFVNKWLFLICGVAAVLGAHFGGGYGPWAGLAVALAAMVVYWRLVLKAESLRDAGSGI
ncbi:MAG: hypothetical protein ABFD69_02850 [Candidatus Sumerlaeia bacterium]